MALPPRRTRRLIVIGLVALAAIFFALAVTVQVTNPENNGLPLAIQSVSPAQGDEVLNQVEITVDLAAGFTGELELNGREIPDDELSKVDGLNIISYRPAPGKTVESLLPEENCVRLRSWEIAAGPANPQIYTWCFFTT